ncbi:MAG: Magnesium and cobalt efflux protein CorC [uncultured marine phage]|uniref:Magnesium and cobalt efflux protein CorC n=1 Tax=uncultured marine phage TaxID=707152 RepID=A0A8D9FRB5_9VIRU|nr:MAG: Magnesium and cobalt efflux protein CorC [uncultured marine phage]
MDILIIITLVLLSGLFSGLTLGLLGLSKSELERKIKVGEKKESKQAKSIYSVRKNGNMLLCTLLLGNVAVNAALTQFLGNFGTGAMVVVISTVLITLFGEILPQALVSKHALTIGSKFVFIVKAFQFILYPAVKPLSVGLDKLLGKELRSYFSKEEFIEEIKDHEDSDDSDIDEDEEKILLGALTYSNKTVEDIMTPKPVVYMLSNDQEITPEIIKEIKSKGHTRIPVYEDDTDNIIGVLLTKRLIGISEGNISDYVSTKYGEVIKSLHLDKMLNVFTTNKQHISIVTNEFGTVVGIVTMEDIIEEILNREIVDETDKTEDMRSSFNESE